MVSIRDELNYSLLGPLCFIHLIIFCDGNRAFSKGLQHSPDKK